MNQHQLSSNFTVPETFSNRSARQGLLTACLTSFLLSASSATADLIAYEGFNYDAESQLDGLNGGFGWGGQWNVNKQPTSTTKIINQVLNAPSGYTDLTGRILAINTPGGVETVTVQRNLQSAIDTSIQGTLWFSMLVARFDTTPNTFGENSQFFRLTDDSGNGISIEKNSNEAAIIRLGNASHSLNTPTIGLIVGKLTTNPSGLNDTLNVSYYLSSATLPSSAPTTFTLNVQADTSLLLTRFSTFQDRYAQWLYMDEIKIGTTYESVTLSPVPEPAIPLFVTVVWTFSLTFPRRRKR